MRSAGAGTRLPFSARRCLQTPASHGCRADRSQIRALVQTSAAVSDGWEMRACQQGDHSVQCGRGSRLESLVHTDKGHVLLARFQAPPSSPPTPRTPLRPTGTRSSFPRPTAPGDPSTAPHPGPASSGPVLASAPPACTPPSLPRAHSQLPRRTPGEGLPGVWDPACVLCGHTPEEQEPQGRPSGPVLSRSRAPTHLATRQGQSLSFLRGVSS